MTDNFRKEYDIIDYDNFEFNKVYSTPRGDIEVITSDYYGKKTFYILMLDGKQVSVHPQALRALEAVKRMLTTYNKKSFWL